MTIRVDLTERPNGECLEEAKVYAFPSSSRVGLKHYVMVFRNSNGVKCSCEGFQSHGHCWHIMKVPMNGNS